MVGKRGLIAERVVGRRELVGRSVERKSGSRSSGREGSAFANDTRRVEKAQATIGTVKKTKPEGVRDRVFGVDRQRTRARESTCRRDTSEPADHQGSFSLFLSGFIWGVRVWCGVLAASAHMFEKPALLLLLTLSLLSIHPPIYSRSSAIS